VSRDDAVRAAAEALCWARHGQRWPDGAAYLCDECEAWARRAIDAAAPHLTADLVTALSNYMDKPWATRHDWWGDVREAFFAAGGEFTPEHFTDPYQLGKEHGAAEVASRVEALCDKAERDQECAEALLNSDHVRAALRGDQS
jgi:hypothetical protein